MQQTLLLRVWLLAAAAGGAGLATPVPSAGGRPAAITTTAAVSASWPWNWSTVKPFNYGNNGSGMDSAAELRRKARYSMLFTDGSEDQGYNATLGPAWDGQRRLSEQVAAYAAAAPGVPAFLYRPASTIPPTFPQASVVNNSDKQHWWLRDAATGLPTPLTLNLSVPEAAEYWIEEVVGYPYGIKDPHAAGIFVDFGNTFACHPSNHSTLASRQQLFNDTVLAWRRVCAKLNGQGKALVVSMRDHFANTSGSTPLDHTLSTCPYPEDVIFELMAGVEWIAHREFHPNEVFGASFSPDVCVKEILDWQAEAQGAAASLWCSYDISNGTYGVPCTEHCPAFDNSLAMFLLGMEAHSYFGASAGYSDWPTAEWLWHPEYDRPLGKPAGSMVRAGAYKFSRKFEHATVALDCEANTTKIIWEPAEPTVSGSREPHGDVASYVVALGPNATADEMYAAEMIADELGTKTCGASMKVINTTGSSTLPSRVIAVGAAAVALLERTAGLPALLPLGSATKLGDEGYIITGGGHSPWLALSGRPSSPRGTSYAAVEFLEAIGLKFLAWDCTLHPSSCPNTLPQLNVTRLPPQYTYRSVYLWQVKGTDTADSCWGCDTTNHTNRFTVAGHYSPAPMDGGEGVMRFLPYSLSETHPSWFWPPPVQGKPPPAFWQVCWSNTSLQQHVISWAEQELQSKPDTLFLQISPNDGSANCQTPLELQQNAEEGSASGAFFRAINAIAEALAPRWPRLKIVSLSYAWTQHPPQALPTAKITKMHRAVIPYFAPIDDNFAISHFLDNSSDVHQYCGSVDDPCPPHMQSSGQWSGDFNRGTTMDIARWRELTDELWVWDYVTDFNGCDGYIIPWPNYYVLADNIKGFAKAGATNYFPEGEPNSNGGEMSELKAYLITKLLWNHSLNGTALIHEFLSGYYGQAAPMMQDYIDAFAEAATPSAVGNAAAESVASTERRFAHGDCVHVADRPWAQGGRGNVSGTHADGTYEVKLDAEWSRDRDNGTSKWPPSHPKVVSWVYLEPCDKPAASSTATSMPQLARGGGDWLYSDMMAESCAVLQNGSHNGWGCGYLTPSAILRGLRAQVAAAAVPGLTRAQAARVRRSSISTLYVTLVKWEELQAYAIAHPEQGAWPLQHAKESSFAELVALLEWVGVKNVQVKWTEAWLRDRIFFGNATGC